jgi:hypothetical protein
MRGPGTRAGDAPEGVRHLFALLPIGRRPDVLGVGRERPGAPCEQGGIAHDGRRGMEVVHVEMRHRVRQLAAHDDGLTEAADAVRARIAQEIAPEDAQERHEGRLPHGPGETAQHARWLLIEIFRQVADGGRDALVHRVHGLVGRMAQRPDFERDSALLEGQEFLGDEGFREPRIAFDHHRDAM